MALNNFETKEKNDSGLPRPKPCSKCFTLSEHENLMKYGSFCRLCYEVYCHDVPPYSNELNKYLGDPKGWARRIIDKHKEGQPVKEVALRFAMEALKCHG